MFRVKKIKYFKTLHRHNWWLRSVVAEQFESRFNFAMPTIGAEKPKTFNAIEFIALLLAPYLRVDIFSVVNLYHTFDKQ